jgi:hypothetical protein
MEKRENTDTENAVMFFLLLGVVIAVDHFISEKWAFFFLLTLGVFNLVRIKLILRERMQK